MPDVFAEFCAAGLWPGVGQAIAARLDEAGIHAPADVTAHKLAGLPRMTDRRANRLVTSFHRRRPAVRDRGTAGAAGDPDPLGGPVGRSARVTTPPGCCARTRGDCWRCPTPRWPRPTGWPEAIEPDVRRDDPRRGRALVEWTLARYARDGHTAAPQSLVADALRPFGVDPEPALGAALIARRGGAGGRPDRRSRPRTASRGWRRESLARAESTIAEGLARLAGTAKAAGRRAGREGGDRPGWTTCRPARWRWAPRTA